MSLSIPHLARAYGIGLEDFGAHRGPGLLVHNGTGMGLAVMDACPSLRWWLDISGLREIGYELGQFARGCWHRDTHMAAAVTFYADRAGPALELLDLFGYTVVLSNAEAGGLVRFDDFAARVHLAGVVHQALVSRVASSAAERSFRAESRRTTAIDGPERRSARTVGAGR